MLFLLLASCLIADPDGARRPNQATLSATGTLSPIRARTMLWEEEKILASDGGEEDYFGYAVATAGDLNGDGYDDVAVGAYRHSDGHSSNGAVYLYSGSSSGLDTSSETLLTASDKDDYDYFGQNVSSAGDLDADGYGDLVVGAAANDDMANAAGSAYVYLGSATGLDTSSELLLLPSDGALNDHFGRFVADAGDLDGDGTTDLLVAAADNDDDGTNSGCVYIYFGSASGLVSSVETRLRASDAAASDNFGQGLAGLGDANGDGYDDIAVGAWSDDTAAKNAGAIYVYSGSADGLDTSSETQLLESDAEASSFLGWDVSAAGDVNGDGYRDVAGGAPSAAPNGALYVYLGSASGVDSATEERVVPSDVVTDTEYGVSVASAGDLDGDGYDDLVVGAYIDDDTATDAGAAYVYFGSATGVDSASEDKRLASDGEASEAYGWAVAGAGDIDGDGLSSLLIGAYVDDDSGAYSGSVYLYQGSCEDADGDGLCSVVDCDDTDAGDTDSPQAWYSDADGDGYGDPDSTSLACGAPSGSVDHGGDCDDTEPLAWTDAAEVCDGVDNNCDGTTDGADATDRGTWYTDSDGDGYGDPDSAATACDAPAGTVGNDGDCDDSEPLAWTDAAEVCDGVDNDCDGTTDVDATDAGTWYADEDGDGYGDPARSSTDCTAIPGAVSNHEDCDDTEPLAWTDAAEVCDGVDNDCDGTTDDDADDAGTWYADEDGDGYGDPDRTMTACEAPTGTVDHGGDCDDTEPLAWADAAEVCDGVDNDCDGAIDAASCEDTSEDTARDTGEEKPSGCGCSAMPPLGTTASLVGVVALLIGRRRARRDRGVARG